MESLLQDVRYGVRMIIKRPGFAAIVVLALALGIGANTAIFSIVNGVLLRPLPFKDSENLVIVTESVRRNTLERRPFSYPDFVDFREQNHSFESMAAFDILSASLTGNDAPERVNGEIVSANFFPILGAQAATGRTFLNEEDATPGAHAVAVLSHGLWQRRFGGDPSLVGRTINLNDQNYTVVGIMPESFRGLSGEAELWIPMAMISAVRPASVLTQRGTRWHSAIARLRPGVTREQAQADLDSITRNLEQLYPNTNKNRGAMVIAAHEEYFGELRLALWVMLGAVGFVLLIACANVANLLLARATARQKEIAIRVALGAGRWRIVRQLITESVILSVLGGALGLFFAWWGIDLLTGLNPVELPSFVRLGIDARVLLFTFGIALLVGVVFGLAPALQAANPNLNATLKEGGRSSSGSSRQRLRSALVVAEIALALVLLVGAGLMLKSFQRLQRFDPGFRADNTLTMQISLPTVRYATDAVRVAFIQRLSEKLESLPSVKSVSLASDVPLDGNSSAFMATLDNRTQDGAEPGVRLYSHSIHPQFFNTLGIALLRGRDFTAQDTAQSGRVAIISEALARRYWTNGDAVGQRIRLGTDNEDPWASIVGVVSDVRYRDLIEQQNSDPDIYIPLLQEPERSFTVLVQSQTNTAGLIATIRHEMQSLDPTIPIYGIMPLTENIAKQMARSRFSAWLLLIFAIMALLLAAAGIFGVMSYTVTQRTQEIAIRMALGARPRDVLRLVVRQGMTLALGGVAIGLIAAFALTRLIASLLYNVSVYDPATFGGISFTLVAVALVACYIPARRATKVDPMIALRYE